MPRHSRRLVFLLALFALFAITLTCAPKTEKTAATPSFTVEPAPPADPGALLPIMLELGHDMNVLATALWRDELPLVAETARSIADHPHVSPAERERVSGVLGERFADFVRGDQRVHDSAVRLAGHAEAGDMTAVVTELAELQAGCVECHATFRAELRAPSP